MADDKGEVIGGRPHILLIHADQHRADCLGVAGHGLVRTPNLDRLAAGGVRFGRAYTPNPVCSPARACLVTGTWATTHRCVTIPGTEAFQHADPSLPILTQLLADRGYVIGHVGRFHDETQREPTSYGVRDFVHNYGYSKWRAQQGLPPRPRTCGPFGEVDPHITPEQSSIAWQADHVLRLLDEYAADGSPGRPILLRWDPPEPHLPNVLPEPFASMYDPADIKPWPSFPDPLQNKPQVQRRTRQRWGTDAWTWDEWAPVVARYLGEITMLDAQVGRVLQRLDDLGLAENTLVIYTADHGDMCGGHGMMDKHYVMYEDNMRVPLLVRWPNVLPAGITTEAMVIHELDIARTLLDAAGVEAPPSFVGMPLHDMVLHSRTRPDVFAQYQGTHQGLFSQRMLRDPRYKYVFNPAAIDELYDLQDDPGELRNLIHDAPCADQLRHMQQRMGQWMAEIGDPLSPPLFDWNRSRLPADHPGRPQHRKGHVVE